MSRSFKGHDQLIGLIGYNRPITSGTVWYDGKIVNSYSYSDGSANRVYVIEQKSHLVEGLSVVDNIFVLRSGFRKYFINEQVLLEQTERFFQENGIHVDISKRVNAPGFPGALPGGAGKSAAFGLPPDHCGQPRKLLKPA